MRGTKMLLSWQSLATAWQANCWGIGMSSGIRTATVAKWPGTGQFIAFSQVSLFAWTIAGNK